MDFKSTFTKYVVPVIGMLLVSVIFFYPQLQDKAIPRHDISAFKQGINEVVTYEKKTGKTILWSNAIFCGMPTYQMRTNVGPNLFQYISRTARLFIGPPIGVFFMTMLCTYLALLLMGVSPWISFFGAISVGMSVNNFILYEAGHMTKLRTVAFCLLIFVGIYHAFYKNRMAGLAVFGMGLGLGLLSNHPQMLYYFAISLLIFGVLSIIDASKENKIIEWAKTASGAIVIALIALGSSASNILPTLEYADDTMRGEPILSKETTSSVSVSASSQVKGLDWEYATNWSNGVMDVVAGFIPGVAGGSSAEIAPSGSQTVKNLRKRGARVQDDMQLPLYWGALGSTGAVFYFGAVLLFFVLLQFFTGNKTVSIWIGVSLLLLAMMSLGRNLEWFNRFLFDYFPYFNKFRTPNSVSTIMSAIIGFGAAMGLYSFLTSTKNKNALKKAVIYAGAPLAVISLFFAFAGPGMFDFSGASDAAYAQQGLATEDLIADRKILMRNDSLRSLLFVLLSAGLCYLYSLQKIKKNILIGAVCVVALFDIVGVGRRYLTIDDFQPAARVEKEVKRPVDEEILRMENDRGAYRVYDMSINTFNESSTSYWHNTIGGYHAAKLQRFEDIKNVHLLKGNQQVLNMLNAKYFITRDQKLQQNPAALGNAWLVNEIQFVNTPDEEILALNDFNPSTTAIVHNEFSQNLSNLNTTGQGTISMSSYIPNKLEYQFNSNSEQLAVFSEVWYGPDKGWKATIDGQPAEILRANYLLRALRVPSGNHTIVFEFDPASAKTGNFITLICSLLLILFCGYIGYQHYKKNSIDDLKEQSNPSPTISKKKKANRKK